MTKLDEFLAECETSYGANCVGHELKLIAIVKAQAEGLDKIQVEASKGDGTTTECNMAYLADEAIAETERIAGEK